GPGLPTHLGLDGPDEPALPDLGSLRIDDETVRMRRPTGPSGSILPAGLALVAVGITALGLFASGVLVLLALLATGSDEPGDEPAAVRAAALPARTEGERIAAPEPTRSAAAVADPPPTPPPEPVRPEPAPAPKPAAAAPRPRPSPVARARPAPSP